MKKIFFLVAIATTLFTSCRKEVAILTNTPSLIGVDQFGNATWQLPNGGQTTTRAIIIPAGNTAGMRLSGEGIITAPPIKPTWEINQRTGQWQVSGFYYNEPEFSANNATAWVCVAYKIGNVITNARAVKVRGSWGSTPSPASYANDFQAGTLNILLGTGYARTIGATLVFDYPYERWVIN